jgi:predicted RNase H-like HicB family nuclease
MSVALPYSVIIRWSDEDRIYIAHLPEFGNGAKTHGDTYEEAAKNAHEVLEMLVESYLSSGKPLPKPEKYEDSEKPPTPTKSYRVNKRSKHLVQQP